jgi:hypothetical protein
MRLRLAVLASVVTTLVAVQLPGVATAAPTHNRGLTINAIPNPILAGEGVFIYGYLYTGPVAGQTIVLYHHLAGSPGYTKVSQTTTDPRGFYEFARAEQVVLTNRSWFVREEGAHSIHSRTVYERVAALVSISPSATTAVTGQSVVFTGHVTPDHAGEPVVLQQQIGSTADWRDLRVGQLDAGSNYAISYHWSLPGDHDVRVLFPADIRNIRSASDPVTVTVEQKQVPGFTINSSAPLIGYGQSVTISGVLDQPNSTTTGEPNTQVTLWARNAYQSQFVPVADTTTGAGGSYSFPAQMPTYNTVYLVRTTLAPHRHTASLFEGVEDLVSMTPSSTTSTVGGTVMFTGTVLPDKAGDVIYLQRLGSDGDWHNVEIRAVQFGSTFTFAWTFGEPGTYEFRARITSDHGNVGGASTPPAVIQVSPAIIPAILPPAS